MELGVITLCGFGGRFFIPNMAYFEYRGIFATWQIFTFWEVWNIHAVNR